MAIYPSRPTQSEFRNRFLANMECPAFRKNWNHTLDLAQKGSSFKILKDRITDMMFRVYSHYGCEILSLIKIDLER